MKRGVKRRRGRARNTKHNTFDYGGDIVQQLLSNGFNDFDSLLEVY